MNTHNVNVKTATPESPKTCDDTPLTQDQFSDLFSYIRRNGNFEGLYGMCWRDLSELEAINEPDDSNPEAATVYLENGWPLAVYEFDIGFTVLRCK